MFYGDGDNSYPDKTEYFKAKKKKKKPVTDTLRFKLQFPRGKVTKRKSTEIIIGLRNKLKSRTDRFLQVSFLHGLMRKPVV